MPSPPLTDRVGLPGDTLREIQAAVAGHGMLDRVIKWGLVSDPPRLITNVIVQDEYTHDVVVPWGGGLYLVYDCT